MIVKELNLPQAKIRIASRLDVSENIFTIASANKNVEEFTLTQFI